MELTPEVVFAIIQSDQQFPIDFDVAWRWVGYSRKEKALKKLENNFDENVDYIRPDNFASPLGEAKRGGHNRELILLTLECLKSFSMMAGTAKGREVRRYFLNCESELKRRIQEERNQSRQNTQQQLVAAMVSPDVVSRQSRFKDEFYQMLYRKRGQGWEKRDPKKFRPSCVGQWTNLVVYDRMLGGTAPGGVKDTLNKVNPRRENGTRKNKHHNHLRELGQFHLETHLYALMAIGNTTPDGDWDMFMYKVAQAFPNNEALQLTLWDIYEQMGYKLTINDSPYSA